MPPKKRWTPAMMRAVLKLRAQGLTLAQIGERYGVGPERARQILFLAGKAEARRR